MKKKLLSMAMLMVVAALLIGAFKTLTTQKLSGDWPYYENVQGLVYHSDLIVIGEVSKKLPSYKHTYSNEDDHIIKTPVEVNVKKVLKGEKIKKLTFDELGGSTALQTQIFEGQKIFNEKDRLVLFLKKVDGSYYPLNLDQAELLVKGNKVNLNDHIQTENELVDDIETALSD